jgi:RNA 2',3'-cyclic 3'-phosphodiesterase
VSPIRAFLALDLDEDAKRRVIELMDRLKESVAGVRWVRPEGLHLTLRFLGWTDSAVLARIEQAASLAARACAAVEAPLAGLGLFPERGSPRVLWLGVPLPPPLHALQRACEEAARREGKGPEDRAFHPHLTLGRWKDRAPRPALPEVDLGTAQVGQVTLYQSELRPSGAIYTPLRSFTLGR